jgi:hypothetical protein
VHGHLRRLAIAAGSALLFAGPSGAANWPGYGGGDLLTGAVLAPIAYAGDEVLIADAAGNLHAFGLPRRIGMGKQGLYAI